MNGPARFLILAAALSAGAAAPASGLGVDVAFSPADLSVNPGESFDLQVSVPDTSASFNAFELVVEFDPDALSLLSYQEGPLMTAACGNRFHVPAATDSTFTVTDGLLCPGQKVHGPGTIYTLGFQAGAGGTIVTVILRRAGFSDAGVTVTPVHTANAVVRIGDVTGIPGDGSAGPGEGLGVPFPNPSSGATILDLGTDLGGPVRVEIFSITGRLVRTLWNGDPGPGRLVWDGADDRGFRVRPGIYLARLSARDGVWARRIVRTGP